MYDILYTHGILNIVTLEWSMRNTHMYARTHTHASKIKSENGFGNQCVPPPLSLSPPPLVWHSNSDKCLLYAAIKQLTLAHMHSNNTK